MAKQKSSPKPGMVNQSFSLEFITLDLKTLKWIMLKYFWSSLCWWKACYRQQDAIKMVTKQKRHKTASSLRLRCLVLSRDSQQSMMSIILLYFYLCNFTSLLEITCWWFFNPADGARLVPLEMEDMSDAWMKGANRISRTKIEKALLMFRSAHRVWSWILVRRTLIDIWPALNRHVCQKGAEYIPQTSSV